MSFLGLHKSYWWGWGVQKKVIVYLKFGRVVYMCWESGGCLIIP